MFGWKRKSKEAEVPEKPAEVAVPSLPEVKVFQAKIIERTGCQVKLNVRWPAELVREQMEESYQRVRAQVKMPGFRAGKVPLDVIKKNFTQAAWEDARDQLLREGVHDAVVQENLQILATPVVDKIQGKPDQGFEFEVKVECAPVVDPQGYRGLNLVRKTHAVTEAEVEQRLEAIRESNASLVPVTETPAGDSHFVVVDYQSFLDGKPIEGGTLSNQLIEMSAPQTVNGFTEGLRGALAGEAREIPVTFPDIHPNKSLAGKTATFKVTVTAVKEKRLPALDDEFAKDVGCKDLADLRARVRDDLEKDADKNRRQDIEKQIIDQLLLANVFDVPASQVTDRSKELNEGLKRMLMRGGATEADWAANEEKMLAKNRPEAERQVRLSYILSHILHREKIEVTDADLETRLKPVLEGATAENKESVSRWLTERRESLRGQMREEKLFDFLIAQAQVRDEAN